MQNYLGIVTEFPVKNQKKNITGIDVSLKDFGMSYGEKAITSENCCSTYGGCDFEN